MQTRHKEELTMSDIQTPLKEAWLEEPTAPQPQDYQNPENYQFALEEYQKKLTTYTARVNWEKEKKQAEETTNGIKYPEYCFFVKLDDYGKPLEPFKPAKIAIWLSEHDHFKTDENTDILYYGDAQTGKWSKEGETQLKKIVTKILGPEDRESHYRNILHSLKSLTYCPIVFSKKLAMENGLFDVETKELTPFSLDEMAFYAIPITYNENIDKSKLNHWLEFLKQVAAPEDIPLLQEWIGYCFLPDYRFHKVLWIHGEGRNGKGVFDRTIKGLLGSGNFSTVGLERLDGKQRFVLKELYGKLYNSSSEPISNQIFQTEIFQKITGQDAIDAEFKNANKELRFVNAAKVTVIGNKFPKIKNQTTAFKDRMIFVKFPNHFDDQAQIQNLESTWLNDPEQRTAIFNWAMEGLHTKLFTQGYFSVSKTQLETEIMFNRVTDNISAFISEMVIIDKNVITPRTVAVNTYLEYCEEIGVEPRKASELTQGLQRIPKVKDGWINTPTKARAWIGLGLRTEILPHLPQLPQQNILSIFENPKNKENKKGVVSVVAVVNPKEEQLKVVTEENGLRRVEVNPDTFKAPICSEVCQSYGKPSCPWFIQKIPNDFVKPLRCHGYVKVGVA